MDVYLPADFYALQDEIPDDWRDAAATRTREYAHSTSDGASKRNDESCADPTWRCL